MLLLLLLIAQIPLKWPASSKRFWLRVLLVLAMTVAVTELCMYLAAAMPLVTMTMTTPHRWLAVSTLMTVVMLMLVMHVWLLFRTRRTSWLTQQ